MCWTENWRNVRRLRHLLTFCEWVVIGRLQRTRKLTERCVTRRFHRQMSRLVGDTTMLWSSSSGSSRADRCHRSQRIRPGRGRSPGPSTADRLATSNLLTFVPQFQSNRQHVATLQLCPAKFNSFQFLKFCFIKSENFNDFSAISSSPMKYSRT